MTPDEHRELGESIADIMADFARAEKSTGPFKVDETSIEFVLKDDQGELAGYWRILVRRDKA